MGDYKLDQTIVTKAPELPGRGLPLQHGHHPLNVLKQEDREVHHPHPGEMHQQANVI